MLRPDLRPRRIAPLARIADARRASVFARTLCAVKKKKARLDVWLIHATTPRTHPCPRPDRAAFEGLPAPPPKALDSNRIPFIRLPRARHYAPMTTTALDENDEQQRPGQRVTSERWSKFLLHLQHRRRRSVTDPVLGFEDERIVRKALETLTFASVGSDMATEILRFTFASKAMGAR